MYCFLNDQFIEEDRASISINDRGFNLGDGVFDTQLFDHGKFDDTEAHFARLLNDAVILAIEIPKSIDELKTIASMLMAKNNIHAGRWIVRTQITRGVGPRGLKPPIDAHHTILMRAIPAPPVDTKPVTAIVAQTVRRNEHSPLSRIKSLNYADNILALIEARDMGADDAILLNTEGFVTCATASNILIREKDKWFTPPISDGVLGGITRKKIIIEKNVTQDSITLDRLLGATEIFQSNSVIGLRKLTLLK